MNKDRLIAIGLGIAVIALIFTNICTYRKYKNLESSYEATIDYKLNQAKQDFGLTWEEASKNIGTKADAAMESFRMNAVQTKSAVSERAQETMAEFEVAVGHAVKIFDKEVEKALGELEILSSELLEHMTQELRKFNENAESATP